MVSSLRHNDVITVKIFSFYKNLTNLTNLTKVQKFGDVSDLKNRQIIGTQGKETFFLI